MRIIKFTAEHETPEKVYLAGVVYRFRNPADADRLLATGKAYDVATGPPKKAVKQRKAGRPPKGETAALDPSGEERTE